MVLPWLGVKIRDGGAVSGAYRFCLPVGAIGSPQRECLRHRLVSRRLFVLIIEGRRCSGFRP